MSMIYNQQTEDIFLFWSIHYIYIYTHTHIYVYRYMYMWMYMYMYTYMYMYMYMHMYMYMYSIILDQQLTHVIHYLGYWSGGVQSMVFLPVPHLGFQLFHLADQAGPDPMDCVSKKNRLGQSWLNWMINLGKVSNPKNSIPHWTPCRY